MYACIIIQANKLCPRFPLNGGHSWLVDQLADNVLVVPSSPRSRAVRSTRRALDCAGPQLQRESWVVSVTHERLSVA